MLYCGNNNLETFPDLPDSLLALWCFDNNLETLPGLPDSLFHLWCSNNPKLDIKNVKFKDGTTAIERQEAGTFYFDY
jgi:hypothetical protein